MKQAVAEDEIASKNTPTSSVADTAQADATEHSGYARQFASASDLEALPEFRDVDPLNVLIGWGAGRGEGKEPLAVPGEAKQLLVERRQFLDKYLPGYADLPPAGQQAVLRAFERGWRAGRAFEWERTERSTSAQRRSAP